MADMAHGDVGHDVYPFLLEDRLQARPRSASLRDRRWPRARMVTSDPSRRKACANSTAITDAPKISSHCGVSVTARASVEVQYGVSANPGV